MKKSITKKTTTALALMLLGISTQAQTPLYSVNGLGGTGGGTSGVSVTPGTSPSGSSALSLIAGNSDFTFGTGVNGTPNHAIVNTGTYGNGAGGDLAGTLANAGSLGQLTITMWINAGASPAGNNERLLDISSGSPTTGSADGNEVFLGLNAGGGIQFYVNNINGNTVGTDISTATVFNGGTAQTGSWYFLAVTYDSVGQTSLLYTGDTSSSASLAYTFANYTAPQYTAVNFGTTSALFLANRPNQARSFPGSIDDVNIYDSALTQSQIQSIQAAQLVPAPEPATLALAGLGGIAMLVAVRRRRV